MNVRIENNPELAAQVMPPPDTSLLLILALFLIATILTAILIYVLHKKPFTKISSQQTSTHFLASQDHPAIARLRARLKSL